MKLVVTVLAITACTAGASLPRFMNGRHLASESVVAALAKDAHVDVPNPSKAGFAVGAAAAYATNVAQAVINLPHTLAINRSTTACGAAVKTVDDYFKSVYPLASKPAKECIGLKPQNSLRFFYDNAPKELIERVGGQPVSMSLAAVFNDQADPNFNFEPPKLWAPYTVFGNDNCTYYINHYPPKAWWTFENAAGVPDNAIVEVMHRKATTVEMEGAADPTTPFNSTGQPDDGWWYYYAPGSGVFFDVGKTLVADNKLGALSALGVSFADMVNRFWIPEIDFFPGQAAQGRYVPITSVYDYMSASARAFTPAQLLEIGAFGTAANLPEGFNPDDLYMANRLANNFGVDDVMMPLAKAAGFNTVQMTVQPNSSGGWGYEIVQYVLPNLTTWQQFFSFVMSSLSTRDPCKGEFDVEPPHYEAGATTLNPAGTCTFAPQNYNCIYCASQDVKTVCGTNRQ